MDKDFEIANMNIPSASIFEIGGIGNYYGGLSVADHEGRYYWSIENYNGHRWEEIPKSLYDELIRFNKEQKNGKG